MSLAQVNRTHSKTRSNWRRRPCQRSVMARTSGMAGKEERSMCRLKSMLSNAKATPALCLSVLYSFPNQATRHACAHRRPRRVRDLQVRRSHHNSDVISSARLSRRYVCAPADSASDVLRERTVDCGIHWRCNVRGDECCAQLRSPPQAMGQDLKPRRRRETTEQPTQSNGYHRRK